MKTAHVWPEERVEVFDEKETIIITNKHISQESIDYLIKCPKVITASRKMPLKSSGKSKVLDIPLVSKDNKYSYLMGVRVHSQYPSNFSITLRLIIPDEEQVMLFRCNGPHAKRYQTDPLHSECHLHRISKEDWASNARKHPESI